MQKIYLEFNDVIKVCIYDVNDNKWIESHKEIDIDKVLNYIENTENVIYVNDIDKYYQCLEDLIDILENEYNNITKFKNSKFKDNNLEKLRARIDNLKCLKTINYDKEQVVIDAINQKYFCMHDSKQLNGTNKKIFSYHTLLFPFVIENIEGNYDGNIDEIINKSYWISKNIKDKDLGKYNFDNKENDKLMSEFKLHYNKMQYFNEAPLRAIYGFYEKNRKDCVVENYVFLPECIHEEANLTIQVNSNGKPKEYILNLNAIRLKVFNTNVSIMIFEIENHRYSDINDIKLINEYVRRVNAPNLTIESNPCAFYWEISFNVNGETKVLNDELYELYKNVKELSENCEIRKFSEICLTKVLEPIKDLLTYENNGNKLTSNYDKFSKCKDKKTYYIKPILDDRMFICSAIYSGGIVNKIRSKYFETNNTYKLIKNEDEKEKEKGNEFYSNVKYRYQIDEDLAKELYSIIYIDPGASSCQSKDDVQTLLERDLYKRWLDWGTIYGITHHSFVAMVTDDCPNYIIDYFLSLYVDMTILALAQRASIILFQEEASQLTIGLEKKNKKIKQHTINDLLNLQEKYIAFQNQLLFFEVSPEEQAVELYDMLINAMYVKEEGEALANQLNGLYTGTNANQSINFSKWALIFAIISLVSTNVVFFIKNNSINESLKIICHSDNIFNEILSNIYEYKYLLLLIVFFSLILWFWSRKKFKR